MEANSRSYLDYLDKLLGEYSNTYYCSIGKKTRLIMTEKIESSHKAPKFKVGDLKSGNIKSGLLGTKTFLAKVTPIIGQKEQFAIDSV